MYEYSSVNASAYDVDSLVAKMNARAAEGWEVVSVVASGGDVVAILKRESTGEPMAPAAAAEPAAVAEPIDTYTPAPAVAYEPIPVAAPDPVPAASEPGGWGAVAEAAPVAAVVTPVAATAPAAPPAAVVTTPAGWYPDPSGRYEMRYWDGSGWTEHVSRQGQQYTDPPVA